MVEIFHSDIFPAISNNINILNAVLCIRKILLTKIFYIKRIIIKVVWTIFRTRFLEIYHLYV